MRDLQTRLEDLQNMMLLKETKMTASESEIKNLTTKLKSEKNNNRKCLSQVANLKMEKFKLSRYDINEKRLHFQDAFARLSQHTQILSVTFEMPFEK